MTSLVEIRKQIEALEAQARELVTRQKQGHVAEVKQKIAEYGLTAADLGFGAAPAKSRRNRGGSEAKYRNAKGETWSGGRGRKPKWVMEALSAGENIEKYRIG